jgi:alcohol dehydrogenase, propanol-preferring
MRAVRFVGVGHSAQITDVAKPTPGPGQVLIKIGGAGVCHSDLHVMEEDLGFSAPGQRFLQLSVDWKSSSYPFLLF